MAAPQPHAPSPGELKKRTIVLVFLIFTNLVGGFGLALLIDARFIWLAIALPTLFAFLLIRLRWPSTR